MNSRLKFIPVGKTRTKIAQLTFTENDLEKIHDLMANFKVHEISSVPGARNNSSNLFPLYLFKRKTNVLACKRCHFITLNRKNETQHNCIYSQEDNIIDENPSASDPIRYDDELSTQSSDAGSPRKRQCLHDLSSDRNPFENEPSSSTYPRCTNSYYMEHENLSMRIECKELATPEHKSLCKARFGSGYSSEDWIEQNRNRVMFLHAMFGFLMCSKMKGDFATIFNTAMAKINSDDNWTVETSRSVSNVRITKYHDGESFLISTARGTKIISTDFGDIRELTGQYSSRRQLEQKLKILRRMNFKVPKNMRRSLAASREQVRNYSEINEYSNFGSSIANDWSALISFSREGLVNYLDQFIMESPAFDYSDSISIAIDSGTVLKCF